MELKVIKIENPDSLNFILGQSHFIKTVEDLHEVLVSSVPGIKFGIAFCEASGPRLVRSSGNNSKLIKLAQQNALNISVGHSFIIFIKDAFPINLLNNIKNVSEVCEIFCATANVASVIVGEIEDGRAILGVSDGQMPLGVEGDKDKDERKKFLRKIGYKL